MTREQARKFFEDRFQGGFNQLVGLEFVYGGKGFAKLRLPLRPELLQPTGILHGGAVATLADVAGGVAAHLTHPPGSRCVTVELKINFLRGISEGAVIAESSALHVGRRTSVWEIRVAAESSADAGAAGRLVAFATATFMVVSAPGE